MLFISITLLYCYAPDIHFKDFKITNEFVERNVLLNRILKCTFDKNIEFLSVTYL